MLAAAERHSFSFEDEHFLSSMQTGGDQSKQKKVFGAGHLFVTTFTHRLAATVQKLVGKHALFPPSG